MKWNLAQTTWSEALKERFFLRLLSAGSIALCLVLTVIISKKTVEVRLIPYGLDQEVSVAANKASAEYLIIWGEFIANLVGNITPYSAKHVESRLGNLLSPSVYSSVINDLAKSVEYVEDNKIAVSFNIRRSYYDPELNKVFVYGMLTMEALNGEKINTERTYETAFKFRHGTPQVIFFDVYDGTPKKRSQGSTGSSKAQREAFLQKDVERAQSLRDLDEKEVKDFLPKN